MNDQYSTNESTPNKQEPPPYSLPPMVDNAKSSFNKQSIKVLQVPSEERESEGLKPNKLFASPPNVRNSDVNFQ
jgi:hypothetical protein